MNNTDKLRTIMAVWELTADDAASAFGVSGRQVEDWAKHGVPSDHVEALAVLATATEVLQARVKAERISEVVRRSAPQLGGRSLLDWVRQGRHGDVLDAVKRMFDLRRSE